jgi:hypothetical protein
MGHDRGEAFAEEIQAARRLMESNAANGKIVVRLRLAARTAAAARTVSP